MSGKKEKQLRRMSVAQTAQWTPFEKASFPGFPDAIVFINSRYQVLLQFFDIEAPFGRCVHLSIKTRDRAPHHDWRDFQRIKNELIGEEFEAVELYPAESRLMDTSNQYHLWCFRDFKFPFGYRNRQVCEETGMVGAVQRPFEKKPEDLTLPDQKDLMMTHEEMYFGKYIG